MFSGLFRAGFRGVSQITRGPAALRAAAREDPGESGRAFLFE